MKAKRKQNNSTREATAASRNEFIMPSTDELIARYPKIKGVHYACNAPPIMAKESFNQLVAEIARAGQLEPIKINQEDLLIDGRHRLAACFVLNIEPKIDVTSDDPFDIAMAGVVRRQLTTGQRAATAAKLMQIAGPAAGQRRLANLKRGTKSAERQDSGIRGRALDIVGRSLGVSRDSIAKYRNLPQDLQQAVFNGTMTLNAAFRKAEQIASPAKDSRSTVLPAKHAGEICTAYKSSTVLVLRNEKSCVDAVIMRLGNSHWTYQLSNVMTVYKCRDQRTAVQRATARLR